MISLRVNGKQHELDAKPSTPLLLVLRNDLGLTAAKPGCALEQCGSCTVLIDGEPRASCRAAIGDLEGSVITTLEGIGTPAAPHPLQQAFIAENAAQCGYCSAGILISAKALLDREPWPSDAQARAALNGHLCRCGSHNRVLRAIQRACGASPQPSATVRRTELSPPTAAATKLPQSLEANPQLDDWLRFDGDGMLTLRTGKVELGQGIKSALALIAAEELDVPHARVRVDNAESARPPIEFMTVGSMSIETSGVAVRLAAAEARRQLLLRAAARLQLDMASLVTADGAVQAPDGQSISYWELMAGQRFACTVSLEARPKSPLCYAQVGRRAERIDLPGIAFGSTRFVQDLRPAGVLYARVVRPPRPHGLLQEADCDAVRSLPGVEIVLRDGSFLAVAAQREEQAIAAADTLRASARWHFDAELPAQSSLHEQLDRELVGSYPLLNGMPVEQPVPPLEQPDTAAYSCRASYARPFLLHGSIGASAALAQLVDGRIEIHCATQGVSLLAAAIAQVLGMPVEAVRVIHTEGPGCYGHNGSDDVALEAALVARALPGRPILMQWSREDEHVFEPYGAAMRIDVNASLDASGRIAAYNHDAYSYTHIGRAFPMGKASALIAAQELAAPFARPKPRPMLMPQAGVHRNAEPLYDVGRLRVVKHLASGSPFRTSSLRSLGAFGNVFAIESCMDELAAHSGKDPLAFRLEHLSDERGKAVLRAGAERARWGSPRNSGDEQRPRGRGLAFSRYENYKCYAAVFVELEVDLASCAIRLLHAVIAADAGLIIDPDGLENQLEGGFLQAASWTLFEQVSWDRDQVTTRDWDSYRILRFEEIPSVEGVLLDRPDQPALGAGEATIGPTPAAIANALFDACGVRLRTTPFTAARLRAALYET